MSQPDFDPIETDALFAGGEAAGAYLDSINKADLTALSREEWLMFLERVVDGFGCHLRDKLCRPDLPL